MPRTARRRLAIALAAPLATPFFAFAPAAAQGAPAAPEHATPTLALGDPAPDLGADVVWLMGMPVSKFEPGKAYTLLLWTPGEAPSLGVLPLYDGVRERRRSEDVVFLSVALSASDPMAPAAQDYVLGRREYFMHSAAQDRDENIRTMWLKAAGREKTPLAFVIDKQGRIAFIGDPLLGMEETIESIADGTFDMEVAKREAARIAAIEEQCAPFIAAANQAAVKRDWQGVLDNVDKVLEVDAEHYYKLTMTKFYITLARLQRPGDAYPLGYQIVEGAIHDDHAMLTAMADIIINQPGVPYRDYNLAKIAALRADEITQGASPTVNTLLATAYFNMGDLRQAVDRQKRAIALVSDEEQKRVLGEALAAYEQALHGGAPADAPAPPEKAPANDGHDGHEGHDHPHTP